MDACLSKSDNRRMGRRQTLKSRGVRMRVINLAPRIVRGSATFLEAVRRDLKAPESDFARETSLKIRDKCVLDGCWNDNSVAILLTDGIGLHFDANGGRVIWETVTAEQF